MITELVAFDTETTGFDARRDDIIEVGAVRFDLAGRLLDTFQCLAQPANPLPAKVVELTGIDDVMLSNAPSSLDACRQFLGWAGESAIFVAHNADFDARFINAAFLEAGEFAPRLPVVDTLAWSKCAGWPVINHKLGTLLDHIGHQAEGLHRALADADGVRALTAALLSTEPDPTAAVLRRLGVPSLPAAAKSSFDLPTGELR